MHGKDSEIYYLNVAEEKEDLFTVLSIPRYCTHGGVFICLEGEIEFSLDEKSYMLQPGELCVIFPLTIVHALRKSENFKVFGIVVNSELFNDIQIPSVMEYYLRIKENPCIPLKPEEQLTIIEIVRLFIYKSAKEHPFRQEIAGSLFKVLYFEIAAVYKKGSPSAQEYVSRKDLLVRKFMYQLVKNVHLHRNVVFYANALYITPRYLSAVIKERTGKSALHWINETLIREAKNLLDDHSVNIQQVAYQLNFPNPSSFGQYFKKCVGMTPNTYRNQNGSLR